MTTVEVGELSELDAAVEANEEVAALRQLGNGMGGRDRAKNRDQSQDQSRGGPWTGTPPSERMRHLASGAPARAATFHILPSLTTGIA